MLTAPVAVSRLIPAGQPPDVATAALPFVPSVAESPLTVSLDAMLLKGVAGVPDTALPLSVIGRIFAATLTLAVLLAQLTGLFLSQS